MKSDSSEKVTGSSLHFTPRVENETMLNWVDLLVVRTIILSSLSSLQYFCRTERLFKVSVLYKSRYVGTGARKVVTGVHPFKVFNCNANFEVRTLDQTLLRRII